MFIDFLKKPIIGARRLRHDDRLSRAALDIDAFLVSYPKSGRTWLRFVLSHYFAAAAGLGFEPNLKSKFRVLPNFDMLRDRGLPAFVGKTPDLPLIAVTHREYRPWLFHARPVIFMVRDMRDVTVSAYFHQTRQKHRFSGTISQFIEDRKLGVPSIIAYLNDWAARLDQLPSLVVSYEAMKADAPATVSHILRFLGHEPVPALVEAAVAAGQFDRMQSLEKERGMRGHKYDRSDDEALRMRKGKVGGYTEYLSEADVARIDAFCAERLTPAAQALFNPA